MPREMLIISFLLELRNSKFYKNNDIKDDFWLYKIHAQEVIFSRSTLANLHAAHSTMLVSIVAHSLNHCWPDKVGAWLLVLQTILGTPLPS
jgi:hypothetical protein